MPATNSTLKFILYAGIFLLLLFPCFVNLNSSHNWGSDFAQYIHQSKNILLGLSQADTYLYNQEFAVNGPRAYPMGFPLLLAPLYAIFGNHILAFSLFISSCLFAFNLLIFFFFKKRYGVWVALIIALLLAYDPWMISFKQNILSDIPFALFCWLSLLLLSMKRVPCIWATISLAFTILIRSVGVACYGALLLQLLYRYKKQKRLLAAMMIMITVSALLVYSVNNLLFDIPKDGTYWDQLNSKNFPDYIFQNIVYYYEQIKFHWFKGESGVWRAFPNLLRILTLPVILLALALKVKFKKLELSDFFCFSFLPLLIIWPPQQGWRFLIAIAPIIYEYYLLSVIFLLKLLLPRRLQVATSCLLLFAVAVSYGQAFTFHFRGKNIFAIDDTIAGPNSKEAQEVFAYIQKHTKEDATIVFTKPRALSLYTGRKRAMVQNLTDDVAVQEQLFLKHQVCYFLTNPEIVFNQHLQNFLDAKRDDVVLEFQNKSFKFYRYKKDFCNKRTI
ncbi:MAG: hypothetical protein HQK50_05555 [Oligoflexia bacterium]|nr:hypothetical protein [Oligoflexia bacterium]MBF0365015.1 hypothetical protein [Oligoflexia bacterium]